MAKVEENCFIELRRKLKACTMSRFRYTFEYFGNPALGYTFKITVHHVTAADDGEYVCDARDADQRTKETRSVEKYFQYLYKFSLF